MKTPLLENARCRVTLSPERGGRIVGFQSKSLTGGGGADGPELVGGYTLQLWLKAGEHHDPAAGMLHLFHGKLHETSADAKLTTSPRGLACDFTQHAEGVSFIKRFVLDPELPLLTIEASVTNEGDKPLNLQIEGSFNWSFGAAAARGNVLTVIAYPDRAVRAYLPPYGDVCCDTFDTAGGAMALCDLDHRETLLIQPFKNWKKFTVYQMAGSNFRGPYSIEKTLAKGESLEVDMRLAIVAGTAAIDALGPESATGLLPHKEVYFTDEPIRVTLGAAQITEGKARSVAATVSAGDAKQTASLEVSPKPYSGDSRSVTFPPYSLRAGGATIEAAFDGKPTRAPIKLFDAAVEAAKPIIDKFAKPVFPVRAIHLITSQQGTKGLTVDALKWLTENVLAPCGYTHAVWEFNSRLKLRSHPELAAEDTLPTDGIKELAKFSRSLGIEPVPQQNLYGHQNETNLLRTHPELQEIPGDNGVYCPTNPKTRAIVADIVNELCDIFEPTLFHMGHDEVQFQGNAQKVGVCPRCRQQKPHEVFAYDVNEICSLLAKRNVRPIMWGDHLIPPQCAGQNVNGLDGEVYRALDLIPKNVIMADWHYFSTENYRSTSFFLAQGHDVWCGVWFDEDGIRKFAQHAMLAHAPGMIYTTWCRPDLTSIPVEGMLYAAQCFQDMDSIHRPDTKERIVTASHRLWREWLKWSSR